MEIILENEIGKVEWDAAARSVVKTFVGKPMGQPMKDIFNAGLDALVEHGGASWVSDNTRMRPYPEAAVAWINEDWFPRMRQAGWTYWAIVEPLSAVGNLSMRSFKDHYAQNGIDLHIVRSVEEGLQWVNERASAGSESS